MKTALFVDCCIRGEASRSRKLAEAFFAHLSRDYTVKRLALMQEELPPLTAESLAQVAVSAGKIGYQVVCDPKDLMGLLRAGTADIIVE